MAEKRIAEELVELRPSEIAQALTTAINMREAMLITGAPGIGKSEVVAQACMKAGAELLITHPVTSDPTDAKGLPWIAAGADHAEFMPFGVFYKALNAEGLTVVFIDDIGQSPDAVQASFMQPVQAREIDGRAFPKDVVFIAATNRRTDKAGVKGILEPVKGRFTIVNMTVDVDDFCNNLFDRGYDYGLDDDAIISGAAFMHFCGDALHAWEASNDISNSPTPRNWVTAFKFAMQDLPQHVTHGLIAGRVGAGYAAQYLGFMKNYRVMPSLEAIFLDPTKAVIPTEPQSLWAVAVGLAAKCQTGNFDRVAVYAERLAQADFGEYASLMIRDCVRREPKITNSRAYVKLASSDLGKLMTGRV